MIRRLPGVFAAGEMLDWEAPTGGYLLQAVVRDRSRGGQGRVEVAVRCLNCRQAGIPTLQRYPAATPCRNAPHNAIVAPK